MRFARPRCTTPASVAAMTKMNVVRTLNPVHTHNLSLWSPWNHTCIHTRYILISPITLSINSCPRKQGENVLIKSTQLKNVSGRYRLPHVKLRTTWEYVNDKYNACLKACKDGASRWSGGGNCMPSCGHPSCDRLIRRLLH